MELLVNCVKCAFARNKFIHFEFLLNFQLEQIAMTEKYRGWINDVSEHEYRTEECATQ